VPLSLRPSTNAVPLWAHDDQWPKWHIVALVTMPNALNYTACHKVFEPTPTLVQSFNVLPGVKCELCFQVRLGLRPEPRGRAGSLPSGPGIIRESKPRTTNPKLVAELDFSFEVGRRLASWYCPGCGTPVASGPLYCSSWCSEQAIRQSKADAWERRGKAIARREFRALMRG
jgi:hypothetical protein